MKSHSKLDALLCVAVIAAASSTATQAATWTQVAGEFGQFTLATTQKVRFGAGTQWAEKILSGTNLCHRDTFGIDPAPNVVKTCEAETGSTTTPTQTTTWTRVANESGTFNLGTALRTFRFGAGTQWATKNLAGLNSCARDTFGGDPAPGVVKVCDVSSVIPPNEPTNPNTSTGPVQETWPPAIAAASNPTGCSVALTGTRTFNVGPGKTYTELTSVPWLSLQAGDVVNIFYRATPYRTKFGLRAQGTATAPVTINGVTDASCNRPEISGDGAVTATDAASVGYGGTQLETLGLILIHRGPTDPDISYKPKYINIQNLKLSGAANAKTYTAANGSIQRYDYFAAGIYATRVDHLNVENCVITGNGQGVFTNSRGTSPIDYSSYVTLRRNRVELNGNPGRPTEHNLYIQAYRTLYEGNYVGLLNGGSGSSIKDRSSGTVIRYNHIVANARALDLVETEEEYTSNVISDPLYHHAWVYGNLLVNDTANQGYSARIIHWSYDNNAAKGRTGTLNFYHNTVVLRDAASKMWETTLFHIGPDAATVIPTVEAWSNIIANYDNKMFYYLSEAGRLNLRGTNFVPSVAEKAKDARQGVLDTAGATLIKGADPLLTAGTYVPNTGSIGVDAGAGTGPATAPTGATLANLQVKSQYLPTAGWKARTLTGTKLDLGAFEKP